MSFERPDLNSPEKSKQQDQQPKPGQNWMSDQIEHIARMPLEAARKLSKKLAPKTEKKEE